MVVVQLRCTMIIIFMYSHSIGNGCFIYFSTGLVVLALSGLSAPPVQINRISTARIPNIL